MTMVIDKDDRQPSEPAFFCKDPWALSDGLTIEYVDRIGSTNQALLDSDFGEVPRAPRVLCAHEQTAGRGRRGRNWLAEPGRSLCFSVAIESRPARVDPSLSLAVGVAVAQTLAPLTDSIGLKWPNDLLRREAKCGGILIERRGSPGADKLIERVVIGVGVNLLRPEDAQGLIDLPAAGVFDQSDDLPDRAHLLGELAEAIVASVHRHRIESFAPWVDAWRGFDAWIGRPVQVSDAGRLLAWGVHCGVASDGSLLLESEGSERRIVAGDVSLRESRAFGLLTSAPTVDQP